MLIDTEDENLFYNGLEETQMSVTKTKARAHMRSFTQKFEHSFGVLTHLPSSDSGIDECAMSSQHST